MKNANVLFCLGFVGFFGLVEHVGFVPSLNAQVLYGSVIGTITDQSGAVVQKAHVVVVNRATAVQRETDADGNGRYRIPDFPSGTYDLKVTVSGFKPLTQTNLRVAANTVANTDVTLQVGGQSDKITIEASAVGLQTEKTDVHTQIPEKAIGIRLDVARKSRPLRSHQLSIVHLTDSKILERRNRNECEQIFD